MSLPQANEEQSKPKAVAFVPSPVRGHMASGKAWTKRLTSLVHLGQEKLGIPDLRPGQDEALDLILKKKDVLAIMPTGSGKSLLYQLPSLTLPGITVVISPLIALIKDQVDKMAAKGVPVCRADSTLTTKGVREMEAFIAAPGGKLVLTTPERISTPAFRELLRNGAGGKGVSLFVVDEAHCISQWGHDFRPAFLTIRKALQDLAIDGKRPPVLATTATAPPHVREDILHQLGTPAAKVVTTSFDRPNLHFEVIPVPGDDEKNKTLITLLKKLPRPGIVYCATIRTVEKLYESLVRHEIPAAKYHGKMTQKSRREHQQNFMAKNDIVMVATNAFGLGVDKSNIRNVIHYHVPGSLESYAQEAGRAGRDRKPSRCVLLFSPDDIAIQEYFLKGTYPTRKQVRGVFQTLQAWQDPAKDLAEPTLANIATASKVGVGRARIILSLLKDEKFVVTGENNTFSLSTPSPDPAVVSAKAKQYEHRRIADRQRLNALLDYVGNPECRNEMMLDYLGEKDAPDCGRCDNCLRSQEASIAAAQTAAKLEARLSKKIVDVLGEDDATTPRRSIRYRLVRIDGPQKRPGKHTEDTDEQKNKPQGSAEDKKAKTAGNSAFGVASEATIQDDQPPQEIAAIDRTAASLAEEGYTDPDAEITILARKKQPKPPRRKKKKIIEEAPPPKKKRRRRKKRNVLPTQEAFKSPILTSEAAPNPRVSRRRRSNAKVTSAPVVEYVRSPMRINMAPVASATPNDKTPKNNRKRRPQKKKPRQTAGLNSGNGQGPTSTGDTSGTGNKKKRRRRRRRKGNNAPTLVTATGIVTSGPVAVFSTDPAPKKKRRRRRRRKKNNAESPTTNLPQQP